VKVVAQTLGVARSQLHERLSGRGRPRQRYAKPEDGELLPAIRSLVDERPTYGYRRIGALLNRQRAVQALPRLNHKRIYRADGAEQDAARAAHREATRASS
jgi:putative transposase